MDAITYLKAKARMTDKCDIDCKGCPLDFDAFTCLDETEPEKAIEVVEKWLAEHPLVTYADKMREVFPKFDMEHTCLERLTGKKIDCSGIPCKDCWSREYGSLEEPK